MEVLGNGDHAVIHPDTPAGTTVTVAPHGEDLDVTSS
ncbi:hypothetical protein Ae406Ps2_5623c [Pseudonocardia sp. Ae406_Ps2]|nr:hypothetical protein Ae331Ps2_0336 [Pseudonocardia sp. Ae331_Ps2]OLM05623.1 hypothetical protein Ae406Ps2_5623c [Pseudonocardia sp. Ae406_Ps2]OLM15429.1 hypothetical protein Ae505Ps2_5561 [Pseudonocardia sp. Ae505_Ps2]OLM27198.1 hypothetical protein Ae706Ps2_5632c [Pseudonocardia sp. Ae706_Ps2]